MDAIFYFYEQKESESPIIAMMYRGQALLVKVGLWVERDCFCGVPVPQPPKEKLSKREKKKELAQYRKAECGLWNHMQSLVNQLLNQVNTVDKSLNWYCVYEENLHWLREENEELTKLWNLVWNVPEFAGYGEKKWVFPFLDQINQYHFTILGAVPYLWDILDKLSPKAKSICWIPQPLQNKCVKQGDYLTDEWIENMVENFYLEYGLAIEVKTAAHGLSQWRLNPQEFSQGHSATQPLCVLDFRKEVCLGGTRCQSKRGGRYDEALTDTVLADMELPDLLRTESPGYRAGKIMCQDGMCVVPQGSLWLDFFSKEECRRQIEKQSEGFSYTSLMQYWKECKRQIFSPFLDSVWKSGYNTFDKHGEVLPWRDFSGKDI